MAVQCIRWLPVNTVTTRVQDFLVAHHDVSIQAALEAKWSYLRYVSFSGLTGPTSELWSEPC